MLENKFYKILNREDEGDSVLFEIELLRNCDVYEGHFPGQPVAPGVCNIQMIKECAELVAGRHLLLNNLQQARLTTLVTPIEHQLCDVRIKLENPIENEYKLRASLGKGENIYLELKAELKCII